MGIEVINGTPKGPVRFRDIKAGQLFCHDGKQNRSDCVVWLKLHEGGISVRCVGATLHFFPESLFERKAAAYHLWAGTLTFDNEIGEL